MVGGGERVASLADDDDAFRFVREAYKHGKAVAACGNAVTFVTNSLPKADRIEKTAAERGVVLSDAHWDAQFGKEFLAAAEQRHWNRGPQALPPAPANAA